MIGLSKLPEKMADEPSIKKKGYRIQKSTPLFLLCLLILLFSCSEVTGPEEAARIQINNLLNEIEDAVLLYEPETVIDMLHYDFLHNGRDKYDQTLIWYQRILTFNTMYLQNREIQVDDHYAEASFEMTLIGVDTTLVTQEPSQEFGDISFFVREGGKWQLYGNQRY